MLNDILRFGGIGVFSSFLLFWVPFMASLLWTFGVHMAGQKEDKFVSYLGVSSLCTFIAILQLAFFGWLLSLMLRGGNIEDPRFIFFIFSFTFFTLQSFLSILFGQLIWKGTFLQSFLTWLFLLIIFFIGNLILWINMFSY